MADEGPDDRLESLLALRDANGLDDDLFRRILNKLMPALVVRSHRSGLNEASRQDALQNAVIALWRRLRTPDRITNLPGYALKILDHKIVDEIRKPKNRASVELKDSIPLQQVIQRLVDEKSILAAIGAAELIASIPDTDFRKALEEWLANGADCWFWETPYWERVGISKATAKQKYYRFCKKCRQDMDKLPTKTIARQGDNK